jgi:hypothetical protein
MRAPNVTRPPHFRIAAFYEKAGPRARKSLLLDDWFILKRDSRSRSTNGTARGNQISEREDTRVDDRVYQYRRTYPKGLLDATKGEMLARDRQTRRQIVDIREDKHLKT